MKTFVMIAALFLWSDVSQAQRGRDIVTGPHGGKMQEVAGVEVELLVGESNVTLCLYARDTPLDTSNYRAVVTVVSGPNRERIELRPTTPGRLGGSSPLPLRPYSTLLLQLTMPNGLTDAVEF